MKFEDSEILAMCYNGKIHDYANINPDMAMDGVFGYSQLCEFLNYHMEYDGVELYKKVESIIEELEEEYGFVEFEFEDEPYWGRNDVI